MQRPNKFELLLNSVSESQVATESIRHKLTEGALELNKVKKIHASKEKQLAEERAQVVSLKRSNRELKVSMVQAMIERDELEAKKKDLRENLEKKEKDIDGLDRQSGYILDSIAPPPPPPTSSHKRQDTRTS